MTIRLFGVFVLITASAFAVGCGKPQPVLSDAQVVAKTHYCEANGLNTQVTYQGGGFDPEDSAGIVAAYCVPRSGRQ